jgi:hypothetical protein
MTNKILKDFLTVGIIATATLGCIGGICEGIYSLYSHNTFIRKTPTERSIVISRNNGLFSSIGFQHKESRDDAEDSVSNEQIFFRPITTIVYWDGGGNYGRLDGKVDLIGEGSTGQLNILARDGDYENYRDKFDKADQELASAKIRFKKYIELIK